MNRKKLDNSGYFPKPQIVTLNEEQLGWERRENSTDLISAREWNGNGKVNGGGDGNGEASGDGDGNGGADGKIEREFERESEMERW